MTPGTVQTSSRHASEFYQRVLQILSERKVDFLVGGAFAFVRYAGLGRDTKDLDIFVRRSDWPTVTKVLAADGIATELTFPHWLGKAFGGREREFFVDVIFSGGNGLAEVDDQWFENATPDQALGFPVRLMPAEEMIWSKAFVMERERFDGADVMHLIRATQNDLDWRRLVQRFGEHWRVLLAHLILFTYIYPTEPVPQEVIDELVGRLKPGPPTATPPRKVRAVGAPARQPRWGGTSEPPADKEIRLCRGTLLSREQYLDDIERWDYVDARLVPLGTMTPEDTAIWTGAIESEE